MFIGQYNHSVDEKGRMAVPVKYRKELTKGAVVTKGLDDCLVLYTVKEWEKLAEKLSNLSITQANTRAFARLMLAGAMDVSLDKQGRIILPDYLRAYAHLGKKVVVAGLYNRIEVWSEEVWQTYKSKTEKQSGEIAEQLGQLGV
ncbi:MAG: division/cell wall cluster transcriptional repressor MraZ [bacterium]|nr:division/cell wall cluster transcriptional repressor MraZ [bacterium]